MILTWIAAAALAAPRPLPASDLSLYVPKAAAAERLWRFFDKAGAHSTLLRPASWRSELHPLFPLELTPAAGLAAWGVDPGGALTVSARGEARLACTDLADPARFQTRVGERLAAAGEPWTLKGRGATVRGVAEGGRVLAGYALQGKVACAFSDPQDGAGLAPLAAAAVGRPAPSGGWAALPGVAYALFEGGALGLDAATPERLDVHGLFPRTPVPALRAGRNPYGALPTGGLALARAQVAPDGIAGLVRTLGAELARVCPDCRPEVTAFSRAVEPSLTGNVALRVSDVELRGPLSSPADRYFAVRHAAVAELKSPERAAAALEALARSPRAERVPDGVALRAGAQAAVGRRLYFRVRGRNLLVGNDPDAIAALAAAGMGDGTAAAHGADFTVDPKALARALGRVSLLDLLAAPELAAVAAAGAELQPLLRATRGVSGTLDSRGTELRLTAAWELAPAP